MGARALWKDKTTCYAAHGVENYDHGRIDKEGFLTEMLQGLEKRIMYSIMLGFVAKVSLNS